MGNPSKEGPAEETETQEPPLDHQEGSLAANVQVILDLAEALQAFQGTLKAGPQDQKVRGGSKEKTSAHEAETSATQAEIQVPTTCPFRKSESADHRQS